MQLKNLSKETKKKTLYVIILLLVSLFSMFVLSKFASSPTLYRSTIQSIDNKKMTVMAVTASAAATSTALASVPGDATSPIANQILEISEYLFIVVCVLVLEKLLLTTIGYLSFSVLVPLSCVLFGCYIFNNKRKLKILASKVLVFALALVIIIPTSVKIGDLIYEINDESISLVSENIDVVENETDEEPSWLESILNKIKDGITNIGETAKGILNNFIDSVATFIITCCFIPIAIIIVTVWFINFLFGLSIPSPKFKTMRFSKQLASKKKKENEEINLV